ncbi:MAG: hypothetical protein IJR94_00210 [Synergistaceae bacterium]|nr:hypothetical protein [Synergistaceae bacterium]
MQIDLPPELEKQMNFWAEKSNETPSALALRLIEEYIDDCQDTHEFFSSKGIDDSCLYNSEEVKEYIGLES